MKQSFRHRITLFLLGTIALTIIMCWFLNLTFLRKYYAHTKLSLMREVHSAVNDYVGAVKGDALSREQKSRIDRIEASENVKIYLFQDVEMDTAFGTLYFTYFIYPEQIILPHNEREPQGGMSAEMIENRSFEFGAPIITATNCRPLRRAVAEMQHPALEVEPVFIPFAPS